MSAIAAEQHRAARIAGIIYIAAMATSMFAELYLRRPLIVSSDVAQTAINIAANEARFRASTVIHLLTFASDAVLAVALFVVLRPVNGNLAMLAAFWRLADCAILSVNLLNDFAIVRLAGGATYLRAFSTAEIQALTRFFYNVEAAGFQIGFAFIGLGSALFSYLWLRSRYIPRPIAAWGIFASSVMAIGTVAIMLAPRLNAIGLTYMAPMFFYEVGLGIWLIARGLGEPR